MTLDPDDLAFLRHLVRRETGVVLGEGKGYLLESRLRSRARIEEVEGPKALVQRMRRPDQAVLRHAFVEDVLIGETQFFRDRHPFDAIEETILPRLVESRQAQRRLHLWSAACSAGQEPYSLAMLLEEVSPRLDGWRIQLLASDVSAATLSRARAGIYTDIEVARGLSPTLRDKYFQRVPEGWQVTPRIRRHVDFREINLVRAWPGLPRMDLILLRNVMIYLDEPTKASILRRMVDLLRPGGTLLLGASETLVGVESFFEMTRVGRSIVYRRPA